MKIFNIEFLKRDNKLVKKENYNLEIEKYFEIGKLVREARVQKNLSIKELSDLSKIPESSLNAIENNNKQLRPKYPFIRSILLKLEECLSLSESSLVGLSDKGRSSVNKKKKNYIIRKFDFYNSWQGSILYFLLLILTLFFINRFFISNISIIEVQIIEEKVNKN